MAIALSQDDYWSLLHESAAEDTIAAADQLDITWNYPSHWGQGYVRDIYLQEGLLLTIGNYCPLHDLILTSCDREHPLEITYILAGAEPSGEASMQVGQHQFFGSGMAPGEVRKLSAHRHTVWVSIHIDATLLCQWVNGTANHLPPTLNHLVKPSDQTFFTQIYPTTVAMQMAVQQILQCPFQGLTQQMYLESKVWELMALQLAQTLEFNQSGKIVKPLKPDDIERIHYAKDVLVSRLRHPPSLMELARIVGINDCKLKAGFRQVFGTTVFGYLHSCRMERSRQLLEAGEMTVTEAARAVGFVNRGHFAASFKRRFGVNPSVYVAQKRQA
ncbi:MAG: helix-turn-helix transcriptional regulator [Elainella sp. C42_A2020_010]|nr:helix-turn-helix transcriptional regulator [Elainella sp. C42_A2020_010]